VTVAPVKTIVLYGTKTVFFFRFSVTRVGNEKGSDQNAVFAQEQRLGLHGFDRDFQTDFAVHERRIADGQTRTGARRLYHTQSTFVRPSRSPLFGRNAATAATFI